MRNLSPEEAEAFTAMYHRTPGRQKTPARLAIDKMQIGESMLFEKGIDFTDYRRVYWYTKHCRETTHKTFKVTNNTDKTKVLVVRTH